MGEPIRRGRSPIKERPLGGVITCDLEYSKRLLHGGVVEFGFGAPSARLPYRLVYFGDLCLQNSLTRLWTVCCDLSVLGEASSNEAGPSPFVSLFFLDDPEPRTLCPPQSLSSLAKVDIILAEI
ncbi:unnamed protein product [Nezara viridula]|uniref:Uncharacterized protein n=1 Tax=Nezara viridula TaxID=85310 RepID=A0A9P0HTN3_NEZVI|nr:unnamed protein product [Nezara viridula]